MPVKDPLAILKEEPINEFVEKFEKATGHRAVGKIDLGKGVEIPYYDTYFVECLCRKIQSLIGVEKTTRKNLDIILKDLRGYGLNELTEEWPE